AVQSYLGISDAEYASFVASQQNSTPEAFEGPRTHQPLVAIFKIHGCLFPERQPTDYSSYEHADDSVVISDEDYFWHIPQASVSGGFLPCKVTNRMGHKSFLFLGYSFRDWNVRSLYNGVTGISRGKAVRDYAVLKEAGSYDTGFFASKQINILETTLDEFVAG